METITLKISGMTCGGCVNSVRKVLLETPGVEKAEVVLDPGGATVSYDPGKTDPQALGAAVEEAGYEVG